MQTIACFYVQNHEFILRLQSQFLIFVSLNSNTQKLTSDINLLNHG